MNLIKSGLKKDDGEYENALKNLTTYLYKYYKKEIILLIDEYDSPLISTYKYQYYDEASTFFKIFYGEALKTNPYLKMGIMTGIIRVVKAGIFSDLNNLKVYSILDNFYSDFFGFTQNEVKEALKYFDIEYEISQVKTWYDDYKFGNSDIYNPWSILNFLSDRKIRPYWIDTSDNFLIKDILKNVNIDTMDTLQKLFLGENVKVSINGYYNLSSLLEQLDLWEFLLFSGYLTINEKIGEDYVDIYSLRIPNREVREFFKKKFIDNENDLEKTSQKAIEQIIKKKYDTTLKERGIKDITFVGIAFFGKLVKICYKN